MTKLIKAQIKDFKNIKNFEVEANGQNIWLVGDNKVGKSSTQQFVKIAMGDAKSIPPDVIANGMVWFDKDGKEYKVKVETKAGSINLKVTMPDGSTEDKKTVIRGIFGGVDFNIKKFVDGSKTAEGRREQIKEFKSMLPQDCIDIINNIEKEIDNSTKDRTEIGRKVDALKGAIKECKLFGDDLKTQSVDVSVLNDDLTKANAFNTEYKAKQERFDKRAKDIEAREAKIIELKAEAAELERVNITENSTQTVAKNWFEKTKPIDTAPLVSAMSSASETNVKASQAKEQLDRIKKLEMFENEYGEFTAEIDSKKEAIRDALRDIDSPVEGLSYEGESLIYNGTLVDDTTLSTAETIELGARMAMAKNPDCGILFIPQGESVGSKILATIQELAKKNNWQIIAEKVIADKENLEVELMVEKQ